MMLLLVDENIERAIAMYLRSAGHEVFYVPEVAASESDQNLLIRANAEQRIILTSDLDFGEIVYRQRMAAFGILLLRIEGGPSAERLAIFQQIWSQIESQLEDNFIVASNSRIRIRRLPRPE